MTMTHLFSDGHDLRAYLNAPPDQRTFLELAGEWRETHLCLLVKSSGAIVHETAFLNAIRGAWGQILYGAASQAARDKKVCPWSPPCALDALFNNVEMMKFPRPYAFRADPLGGGEKNEWDLRLILYGASGLWADEAMSALIQACGREITCDREKPVTLNILARDRSMPVTIPLVVERPNGLIHFVTPYRQTKGADDTDTLMFFKKLTKRIRGLARWHGIEIMDQWPDLLEQISRVSFVPMKSEKGRSVRNPRRGQSYSVDTRVGTYVVQGMSSTLSALVQMGGSSHFGSGTGMGFGRYEFFPEVHADRELN